ncbi:putative protein kinase RLK-Pelle-SD-2b family [Dioscorea sansibarensis]
MAPILHILLIISLPLLVRSDEWQPFPNFPSTAKLPSHWTNTKPSSSKELISVQDGSLVRPILVAKQPFKFSRIGLGSTFSFGFICSGSCDSFVLAIAIMVKSIEQSTALQVVWSANRDKPVKENATLELKKDGDFVLTDTNGTIVWSTGTSGKPVSGINLTDNGSLVLFDSENNIIWNSYDFPVDTLLPGQRLTAGQRLVSRASTCNWTHSGSQFLLLSPSGFSAFLESDGKPQVYYRKATYTINSEDEGTYLEFMNGNVSLVLSSKSQSMPPVPPTLSPQFLRLDPDGHLRLCQLEGFMKWKVVADLFDDQLDYCDYPLACGSYGVCSNSQCSCPQGGGNQTLNYFSAVNYNNPVQGCVSVTPLDCQKSQKHHLLSLENVYYFYHDITSQEQVSAETCKAQCLMQCGCKAVAFVPEHNNSGGQCTLISQLFSMKRAQQSEYSYNSSVFLKVQAPEQLNGTRVQQGVKHQHYMILGCIAGGVISVFLALICVQILYLRRKSVIKRMNISNGDISAENYFNSDHASELPRRFRFEDLRKATCNFSKELGRGGSGLVFEGILNNGMKVAVKRMERISQGKKQFLAEIETIHGIHHINLVRLIGYCVEKSYYFLVYDFMSNGSLDKWIFDKNNKHKLDWGIRHRIIIDVAKGLSYLHEDCRKRILHLDIKPQNILVDENFNAKIADFGLSKLVERDQSKVMTTMRGTVGYLAPEWLNSVITEKVDVYSFGILVLEIICGRKNFDFCQPIEDIYLLKLVKEKAHDDKLHEIVAKDDCDMELHMVEAVKMIRVAMWCLQSEHNLRPAMSKVVKVLEDAIDIDTTINYEILIPSTTSVIDKLSHPFFKSALSGI